MNLPILMYHKIQARRDPGSDLAVTIEAFSRQVEWLRRRGYQSLPLAEVAQAVRRGVSLPRRAVVITFDDAYASVLEYGMPVLASAGFTATVFVVPQALGKGNYWDEGKNVPRAECVNLDGLQKLVQAGWEIGSHGATHANLTQLADEPLRRELEESKRDLEAQITRPVKVLSYPYGAWDARARAAAERAGYTAACAISPGTASVTADLMALRRVYVKPSDSLGAFARKVSGWYLAFRAWRKR
jgi:peptidoglycan/xylan/chitin deacetylase (PgdA/CDA1 family)